MEHFWTITIHMYLFLKATQCSTIPSLETGRGLGLGLGVQTAEQEAQGHVNKTFNKSVHEGIISKVESASIKYIFPIPYIWK